METMRYPNTKAPSDTNRDIVMRMCLLMTFIPIIFKLIHVNSKIKSMLKTHKINIDDNFIYFYAFPHGQNHKECCLFVEPCPPLRLRHQANQFLQEQPKVEGQKVKMCIWLKE